VFLRYEALRAAGQHQGPALDRVRLYYVEWNLDPAAANVESPDTRVLISEYAPGGPAAP
jgi:hypothetical protein